MFLILRHRSSGKDKATQAFSGKVVSQPSDGIDDIPKLVLLLKDDHCFPGCHESQGRPARRLNSQSACRTSLGLIPRTQGKGEGGTTLKRRK